MTAPRFVACRCGHAKAEHEHEGLAPQCVHHGCTCLQYRAETAPDRLDDKARLTVAPARPAPVAARAPEPEIAARGERGPTIEQILQAGKRSEFKRTVTLTEKIALLIHDLRGRLTDERQAAEEKRKRDAEAQAVRAEVERLQRELAAAKAKLSGRTTPRTTTKPVAAPSSGAHTCYVVGCDRAFATSQARAMHQRRAHEGFNPNARKVG